MKSTSNIIFTNGVFDILHIGHIRLLMIAKSLGDTLIVGLNNDDSVKRLKGRNRPINNEADRMTVLKSIRYVNDVIIFKEDTPYELIKRIKPSIIVKGGDYNKEEVVGADLTEVYIVPHSGHSTTKIITDNKENKTYCFDIDGTLCDSRKGYKNSKPYKNIISIINKLYYNGNIIKIYTARGKESNVDWEEYTKEQLKNWNLHYHEIVFNKPSADYYIDDKLTDIENILKENEL